MLKLTNAPDFFTQAPAGFSFSSPDQFRKQCLGLATRAYADDTGLRIPIFISRAGGIRDYFKSSKCLADEGYSGGHSVGLSSFNIVFKWREAATTDSRCVSNDILSHIEGNNKGDA